MHCEESECSLQTLEARSPIGYWAALFDVVNTRHHNNDQSQDRLSTADQKHL